MTGREHKAHRASPAFKAKRATKVKKATKVKRTIRATREGIEKIIVAPPIASEYNTYGLHYVVYVAEDGNVTRYAPLDKSTPTVIELDPDAKGTLYLNSFTDELNYLYVKDAVIVRRTVTEE